MKDSKIPSREESYAIMRRYERFSRSRGGRSYVPLFKKMAKEGK